MKLLHTTTIRTILLLAAFALLMSSCKKSAETPEPKAVYSNFSAESLSYVLIPKNRKYVYTDSATGISDTLLIAEADLFKVVSPTHISTGGFFGNSYTYTVPETHYDSVSLILAVERTGEEWFKGLSVSNSSNDSSMLMTEQTKWLSNYTYYPFRFDHPKPYTYKPTEKTTITIGGVTYSNAVIIDQGFSAGGNYSSYYIWSPQVGILKRSIRKNNISRTWTLVAII